MIRRALAAALALALVIPGAALGATSGGSTTETLIVDVTISMTVPASPATYSLTPAAPDPSDTTYDTGALSISNLTTNNLTGLRVDMTTSTFVNGANIVQHETRSRDAHATPSGVGWDTAPNGARVAGYFVDNTTADWQANRTTPTATAGAYSIVMHAQRVDFTAPGTYSGVLSFVAATNP